MLVRSPVARRLRGLAAEGGQAIVLVVVSLVVLLGMAALVIDIGYADYTHRSLQASADAAALAGAQELPDASRAQLIAQEYTAGTGQKNDRSDIDNVTTTITTKCIASRVDVEYTQRASGEEATVRLVSDGERAVVESAPTKTRAPRR